MDAFTQFEKDAWQETAGVYHSYFDSLTAGCIDSFERHLPENKNAIILDCACGPGTAIARYQQRFRNVVGVDFSDAMTSRAKLQAPDSTVIQSDVCALPFANNSVHAVSMAFGLLHLATPEKALAECHRILAADGIVQLTVWEKPDSAKGFAIVIDSVKKHASELPKLPNGPDFFLYSDTDYTIKQLQSLGFSHVEAEHLPLQWLLPSTDAFFSAFKDGTARTGALLRSQDDSTLQRIKASIEEALTSFASPTGYSIPMPAIMYRAKIVSPH